MKKQFNVKEGKAKLIWKDKDLDIDLAGLPMSILTRLALEGAASILMLRRDPLKTWKEILKGQFEHKKKLTLTQQAAWNIYQDISKADRKDPLIQIEIIKIKHKLGDIKV